VRGAGLRPRRPKMPTRRETRMPMVRETLTPATSQTRRRKRVTPTSLPTPTPNVPTLVLTGQTPATLLSKVKQGHLSAAMESAPQTRNATSDRPRTSRTLHPRLSCP